MRRLVCVAEMPDRGRSSKSALAKGRDWYLGWNCIRNPSAQYAAEPSTPVRVAIGAERPCDMNPAMSIQARQISRQYNSPSGANDIRHKRLKAMRASHRFHSFHDVTHLTCPCGRQS